MDKYKNKYRIPSHRRPEWDYSGDGIYFITLVTQNRECNLAQIVEKDGHRSMELSDFGKIIHDEWVKSFQIRQELITAFFGRPFSMAWRVAKKQQLP